MRRLLALTVILPLVGCATNAERSRAPGFNAAPVATEPKEIVAPSVPVLAGLPHAVKVGLTVYVSGMVPVDSAGALVGAGDLGAQTRQVMKNLAAVVQAAQGVPGDVVRLTVYLTDISPAAIDTVRPAVLATLDPATPPALTIVGVTALPEPGMRIMIDATAQLRSVFPDRSRLEGGGRR